MASRTYIETISVKTGEKITIFFPSIFHYWNMQFFWELPNHIWASDNFKLFLVQYSLTKEKIVNSRKFGGKKRQILRGACWEMLLGNIAQANYMKNTCGKEKISSKGFIAERCLEYSPKRALKVHHPYRGASRREVSMTYLLTFLIDVPYTPWLGRGTMKFLDGW